MVATHFPDYIQFSPIVNSMHITPVIEVSMLLTVYTK